MAPYDRTRGHWHFSPNWFHMGTFNSRDFTVDIFLAGDNPGDKLQIVHVRDVRRKLHYRLDLRDGEDTVERMIPDYSGNWGNNLAPSGEYFPMTPEDRRTVDRFLRVSASRATEKFPGWVRPYWKQTLALVA